MAKGEAHQAGNLQAACDGDGPLAVPSQLVVQVGFEGSVWRQASTTGGRPESYRAEVQAWAWHRTWRAHAKARNAYGRASCMAEADWDWRDERSGKQRQA